jgi:hypothetical protein
VSGKILEAAIKVLKIVPELPDPALDAPDPLGELFYPGDAIPKGSEEPLLGRRGCLDGRLGPSAGLQNALDDQPEEAVSPAFVCLIGEHAVRDQVHGLNLRMISPE